MFAGKSWEEWIHQYAQSHQHPVNRFFHTVGIPLIAASVLLFVAAPFVSNLWKIAAALFVVGWIFQFIGHAFEGKPPEFFATGVFCSSVCAGGARKSADAPDGP